MKRFVEGGGGVKNVYCLSLPPYLGEERDPIHGSLLLVGGKLTAFYLQVRLVILLFPSLF